MRRLGHVALRPTGGWAVRLEIDDGISSSAMRGKLEAIRGGFVWAVVDAGGHGLEIYGSDGVGPVAGARCEFQRACDKKPPQVRGLPLIESIPCWAFRWGLPPIFYRPADEVSLLAAQ